MPTFWSASEFGAAAVGWVVETEMPTNSAVAAAQAA